jgi:hypothetical protein
MSEVPATYRALVMPSPGAPLELIEPASCVTAAPVATTFPAPSDMGMRGHGPSSSPCKLTMSW